MNKLQSWLLPVLLVACLLSSCNNGGDEKVKSEVKTTEITVTTKNKEAAAAFQQGLAAYDLNDIKKARTGFNEAIKLDPALGIALRFRHSHHQQIPLSL